VATNGILEVKQKNLILCFYKPMSPSELRKLSAIDKNYISYCLKRLSREKLVHCLLPNAKTGRIYGLTTMGVALRKELILSEGNADRIPEDYFIPDRINWNLYGWVLAGKGRREYLRIMNGFSNLYDGTFKASNIFTRFRYEEIKSTPRTEVYRAIKEFHKKDILSRIKVGKRNLRYKLTPSGRAMGALLSA